MLGTILHVNIRRARLFTNQQTGYHNTIHVICYHPANRSEAASEHPDSKSSEICYLTSLIWVTAYCSPRTSVLVTMTYGLQLPYSSNEQDGCSLWYPRSCINRIANCSKQTSMISTIQHTLRVLLMHNHRPYLTYLNCSVDRHHLHVKVRLNYRLQSSAALNADPHTRNPVHSCS